MKKMTAAAKAKMIREMADSIAVRDHMLKLINTRVVKKDNIKRAAKFVAMIDDDFLNHSLQLLNDSERVLDSLKAEDTKKDVVKQKEKAQKDKKETKQQSDKVRKGSFSRVQ